MQYLCLPHKLIPTYFFAENKFAKLICIANHMKSKGRMKRVQIKYREIKYERMAKKDEI